MTREQFAAYCWDGLQWTPATIAAVQLAQSGWLPKADIETFEKEVSRPDGVIEVTKMEPMFVFGRNNLEIQSNAVRKG